MNIKYIKHYSNSLGRDMEVKVYGEFGKPLLYLPSRGGRFYEFENKMKEVYAPYIENGDIQVFCPDELDYETLAGEGDPEKRMQRYEQWIQYIISEAVPMFSEMNEEANGWTIRFAICGISMGAGHGANLFFRYPDVFDAFLGLSGTYACGYYFKNFQNAMTQLNSPILFLKGVKDEHFLEMYRQSKIFLCSGQSFGERQALESTIELESVLKDKNIECVCEYWGEDSEHDFEWWKIQTAYFLPGFLKYY